LGKQGDEKPRTRKQSMTRKLTIEAFERARTAVIKEARRLDVALLRYCFDHGSGEAVIRAAEAYQSSDGGFGRAIEPDFRLEASSVMATVTAFEYLRAVHAPADDPVVQRGVRFLLDRFKPDQGRWPQTPREVNLYPHAPWWHHNGEADAAESWAVPNANAVAILHTYAELVPPALLDEVTQLAHSRLEEAPSPLGPYAVAAFLDLAESAADPATEHILARLRSEARQAVRLDPEGWESDHFQPFWIAETPESPLAEVLQPELGRNLEWQIERQGRDGLWQPGWDWYLGQEMMGCDCSVGKRRQEFERAWGAARSEWAGQLTVRTLRALQAHGMIES
jgi:hypothetical protein